MQPFFMSNYNEGFLNLLSHIVKHNSITLSTNTSSVSKVTLCSKALEKFREMS